MYISKKVNDYFKDFIVFLFSVVELTIQAGTSNKNGGKLFAVLLIRYYIVLKNLPNAFSYNYRKDIIREKKLKNFSN